MTHTDAQLAAIELAWSLPDDHTVTADERATLEAFTGWGSLAPAFGAVATGTWSEVADRLDAVVPDAALSAAAGQVDTSFFTPATVTAAVWRILLAAGFTGGRVLEPGCGSGAFMSTAPAGIPIDWTGVEIDPTSARIARQLHPGATVLEGAIERTPLRDGWFDAAIGNVPFSKSRVYDAEGRGAAIHNYFALRAAAAVRPGGYVVLVTSRYAIDSSTTGLLSSVADWNDTAFIGAVRLPAGAFNDAGTQAVTDIIVLRKNDDATILPAYAGEPDFATEYSSGYYSDRPMRVDKRVEITDTISAATAGATVRVSRYWAAHPDHVAGRMLATGYEPSPLTVRSESPADDIDRAVTALTSALVPMTEPAVADLSDVPLVDEDGRKEGSFHVIAGSLQRVVGGALTPVRASKELIALVALRDLALDLLDLEANPHTPDAEIDGPRAQALAAYQAYVAAFGHLNRGTLVEGAVDEESGLPALSWRRPTMGGFRRDPDSALVMALETFDQDSGEAGPAPILLRRVNHQPVRATRADTAAEALAISLGETGTVDMPRIAGLLGVTEAEAAADLGELVFTVDGALIPAGAALSGNVRAKLAAANAAAARGDQEAARYAAALTTVLPADLGPTEINITLGSPFVTADDIRAFLQGALGVRWPTVTHTPSQAVWDVEDGGTDAAAALEWGVPSLGPGKLVECALNNKLPEVFDTVWRDGRTVKVRNPQLSAAANTKLEMIADRFSTWVWEDADRAARICTTYNEALNSHVVRRFDGSGLTFPGLASTFTPWPHQRAAVERIVSSPRALLGHPVGAGKTSEMIMGARTLRQFGLAQKPMIVVPNHLLDQIAREAQQLYPTGRFLIATKDDLARDARRVFAARCATGDWDAVIITHSAFGQIPVRPDVEQDWIQDQKHALRWALQSAGNSRSRGAKAIARATRALDTRLWKLRDGKNDQDTIFFEQLGVDYIMVDEAHLFRRLDVNSQSRDNGMGSGSSKRATDLLLKVETLAARKPDSPVVSFFTGTPWSNTLAETWVWQRYLQPDDLDAIGLLSFDAWVSAFIRYESNIEVAPDGSGFRMYRRPIGVVNTPELKTLLGQVADIMDPAELGLARPDFTVENVTVPATPLQRAFVQDLAVRADKIRSGSSRGGGAGGADNMLVICNDGRKIALDPVLAGIEETSAKITAAADLIAEAHRDTAEMTFGAHPVPGGFQLVFMDLGTPHPGDAQTYGRLRRGLVDRGIPAARIRFVHDATTDKARAALFAACRDGEVSVLIASTSKAGMGTNIQTRLTHLWHIDAPWLPSEVIQREGRAIRPGNHTAHVQIRRLVTEGTFDAYMWQALERKSRAFDALYATGSTAREIEDVSAATMSYGEVKALASGNPLLLDQAKVRAQVKQLQMLRAMHRQGVNQAIHRAQLLEGRVRADRHRVADLHLAAERVAATAGEASETSQLARTVAKRWHDASLTDGYLPHRIEYRGLDLDVVATRGFDGHRTVRVLAGYRTVRELSFTRKDVRRQAEKVAALILAAVDTFIDDIPAAISRTEARAAAEETEAAENHAAAAASTFDREPELTAALAHLAQIDAAIAADVTTGAVAA